MSGFDIVDWLRANRSLSFEDEDDAFQYLLQDEVRDELFSELCIDGVYDPQNGCDTSLLSKLGEDYAKRHAILLVPFDESRLALVTTDPFDVDVIDDVRSRFGNDLAILLAKSSDIKQTLPSLATEFGTPVQSVQLDEKEAQSIEDLLERIISESIKLRASDIHFEHNFEGMRIRNRIDGNLVTVRQIDPQLARALISAIKLRSGLKIDETRLPQDGRIRYIFDDREYDIRLSILPTIRGENVAMRLFNGENTEFSLKNIGLNDVQLKYLKTLSGLENGLILVSGPTGSGKTTTLYSLLKSISSIEKKVVTVEDPVEYRLEHVNQVAVNESIGLTFGKVIRALLRQAPNVIFIGEIRDAETAQIAMQASLTGHLVLSSVHAGNAEGAIIRLRDLGISDYFINSCVRVVIAQRLVRLRCENSCHSKRITTCPDCFGRGYHGRTGVFEIMLNNELDNNRPTKGRPSNRNPSPSRLKNFGYLCTMRESIDQLIKDEKLFDEDRWLFE